MGALPSSHYDDNDETVCVYRFLQWW